MVLSFFAENSCRTKGAWDDNDLPTGYGQDFFNNIPLFVRACRKQRMGYFPLIIYLSAVSYSHEHNDSTW
jgi:hypothetical protein